MLMVGRAALDAAARFREATLAEAARRLGAEARELDLGEGGVRRAGAPVLSWADLERGATPPAGLGRARLPPGLLLDPASGNEIGAIDHMYAAHGVDLAVSTETGEVRLLRAVTCQDAGKLIDPQIARGQVLGAATMGAGQALWEKLFTEGGLVRNASMHDYLIPSMLDVAPSPEIEILELGEGLGPRGARGVGEAGAVAAPIAIAHALFDALGAQVERIPATPEDLVRLAEGFTMGEPPKPPPQTSRDG
jgi:CO/xanthine dehydrogenase Mo-binding subunit